MTTCIKVRPNGPPNLILVRHGESIWNKQQRFTGWADVGLTATGEKHAIDAASSLRSEGIQFDVAYSSVLKRSIKSLWLLLETLECQWIPVTLDWRLNERHYGALTGMLKADAVAQFGSAAVHRWRRSYDGQPPAAESETVAPLCNDRRYAGIATASIPVAESLAQTVHRVAEMWIDTILPALLQGQRILVMSHGNSIRALVKLIEKLSNDEVMQLEIPNSSPLAYWINEKIECEGKVLTAVSDRDRSDIL